MIAQLLKLPGTLVTTHMVEFEYVIVARDIQAALARGSVFFAAEHIGRLGVLCVKLDPGIDPKRSPGKFHDVVRKRLVTEIYQHWKDDYKSRGITVGILDRWHIKDFITALCNSEMPRIFRTGRELQEFLGRQRTYKIVPCTTKHLYNAMSHTIWTNSR